MGDTDVQVSKSSNRYVYRGMSPTTENRLQHRVRELEDQLEAERESRLRADRNVNELHSQLTIVSTELDESSGLTTQQMEMSRRRDAEVSQLRREIEQSNMSAEEAAAHMRKMHQTQILELNDQLEHANRGRHRAEKDKTAMLVELDSLSSGLDAANKAKMHAESQLDSIESSYRTMKAQNEDFTRQITDMTHLKTRLTNENMEFQRQLHDLEIANTNLGKARSALQQALEDCKHRLEEEVRVRSTLQVTVTTLQSDFDSVNSAFSEEQELSASLRNQVSRLTMELTSLKAKYEKEMLVKIEELEEARRRLQSKLSEMESELERERSRANASEKAKSKMMIEIRELTIELETCQQNYSEAMRRAGVAEKELEGARLRISDLERDLQKAVSDNHSLVIEVKRLKGECQNLADKLANAERENKQLADQCLEAREHARELNRQVQELSSIRVALERERDTLMSSLHDAETACKEWETKYQSALNDYNRMKAEMEARFRKKEEELENLRVSSRRTIEELQTTIIEIETRYKSELSRLKKKFEVDLRDLEQQLDIANKSAAQYLKDLTTITKRCKEIEILYEEERRGHDECRSALSVSERKRAAAVSELEELRVLFENADRARKNAEQELEDAVSRVNELQAQLHSALNERRRLEGDLSSLQADFDTANNAQREANERADRYQLEVNRLTEELRHEQDNYRQAESMRKSLEIEIREITIKLEEAEAWAQKEGKRLVAKLTARVRELESELDIEVRNHRVAEASWKKFERQYRELLQQSEEDRRVLTELQAYAETANQRIRSYKKQLDEAEDATNIALSKYRKLQSELEETENRADIAEKNLSVVRMQRSSVSSNTVNTVNVIRRSEARRHSMSMDRQLTTHTVRVVKL